MIPVTRFSTAIFDFGIHRSVQNPAWDHRKNKRNPFSSINHLNLHETGVRPESLPQVEKFEYLKLLFMRDGGMEQGLI